MLTNYVSQYHLLKILIHSFLVSLSSIDIESWSWSTFSVGLFDCHVNSESNVRFYLLTILNKDNREYKLLMYLVGRIWSPAFAKPNLDVDLNGK